MNHYLSNIGPIQRNVFWGTFMIMNEVLTICLEQYGKLNYPCITRKGFSYC